MEKSKEAERNKKRGRNICEKEEKGKERMIRKKRKKANREGEI